MDSGVLPGPWRHNQSPPLRLLPFLDLTRGADVAETAIGTSAAIGFPIAVAGTVGYIYNGFSAANLPEYSVGYVYLPALVGIVVTSVLTAPLGVRLAHSLPVDRLKRVFALLLLVVGTRMLISII